MILLHGKWDHGVALDKVNLLTFKWNPHVRNYDCNVFFNVPFSFSFFSPIKIVLRGNCFTAQYSRQRSKFWSPQEFNWHSSTGPRSWTSVKEYLLYITDGDAKVKQHHACSVLVLLPMPCKMLLQLFLFKRPQEQLRDALATASLPQPLTQICYRVGNCQDVTEDPGKDPLANGHNAVIKLTGPSYGPQLSYRSNSQVEWYR